MDIVAAWLFGSVARGDDHADSDVDVGLLLASGPPASIADHVALTDLADELQAVTQRHVDVVALNAAHPELVHRVLRDGILLQETDSRRRILFEVKARNEFFDMQPIWTAYRRAVLESL
jgi:predicted nucleotidyltransferase